MNINHLLLWFVGLSCISVLVRTLRMPTDDNRGWRAIAGGILSVTVVGGYLVPQQVGFIGGGLWLIFLVMPLLGVRGINLLIDRERYQAASRLATFLGWLHPMDGWRTYPTILRAIALAQQGNLDQAIAILSLHQSPATPIGRLAALFRYRLEARWEELLTWIQTHQLTRTMPTDPSIMLGYLRSLGETGQLNELLQTIESFRRYLERTGNPKLLHQVRLFALAFCGQPDQVQELFNRVFHSYPPTLRNFWLATAEMAAGRQTDAQHRLSAWQEKADPLLQRAIAHRLTHPPVLAQQVLTPSAYPMLLQLDLLAQQESRYRNPFTFIGRTSYATYGLIAANLGMFALEIALGGSQNEATLYQLGALVPLAVWQGDWWRLLAANFLHFGFLHLAMNMLGLYLLGGFVESTLGVWRYLLAYLTSGVGTMGLIAIAGTVWGPPDQLLVGASAGIMGLVGVVGAIMLYGWYQDKSRLAAKNLRILLFVIAFQVVFDLTTPGISFTGHTLGLVLGFLIGNVLLCHWRPSNAGQ